MSANESPETTATAYKSTGLQDTVLQFQSAATGVSTFIAAALPSFIAPSHPGTLSETLPSSAPVDTSSSPGFPSKHTVTPQEYYIQYVDFLMKQGLVSAGSQQVGFVYRHLRELQRTVSQDSNELLTHSARFTAALTPQLGGGDGWINDWMEHLEGFIRDSGRCACEMCVGEPRKWWSGWVEEI